MNRAAKSNSRHRERGRKRAAVTVELAVTLPVLIIFLLGSIDAGQFATAHQVVSDASRESARMAARADTENSSDVEATVLSYLDNAFANVSMSELSQAVTVRVMNESGATISDLSSVESGSPISVEVSLLFDTVRVIPGISELDNRTIQATTHMCRQ